MRLCADLGGTMIKAGLLHERQVVRRAQMPSRSADGLAALLPELRALLTELCAAEGIAPRDCEGLGLCLPGLVDSRAGKYLAPPRDKFADAMRLDLAAWARDALGMTGPFILENDAHAACIGEWRCGAGAGCDNLVMVTLGTGIGVSVILQGHLLRGRHGQAGVLGGHFVMNPFGDPCGCGGHGCVEIETSIRSVSRIARADPLFASSRLAGAEKIDYAAIFAAGQQGDPLASRLVTRSLRYWAAHAVSLIHAFDPERIILGGGIMGSADTIVPYIQTYVDENAWTPWGQVKIVPAAQGSEAALLGLSVLLTERMSYL